MKKKKILLCMNVGILLLISICRVSSLMAQAYHYSVGIPGTNEVAVAIRPLPDGSSIIAGYTYTGAAITDADMILMKVKDGAVLWARKWGNAGGNDFIQDMMICANGDIVVVADEHMPSQPSGAYGVAAIYRFTGTGTILHQYHFYGYAPYNGDAIMQSVCELHNGNIVVAGYLKTASGGKTRGVIATMTGALVWIYHDVLNVIPTVGGTHQHTFNGIVPDASNDSSVLVCGSDDDGVQKKGLLLSYTPPTVQGHWGTFNSYRIFDIEDGSRKNSVFTEIFYAYTDPGGFHNNDRLFISGKLSDDCCGQSNSEQFTFSSNIAGTANLSVHRLVNGNAFTNTSKVYPYHYDPASGDFETYTIENPYSAVNDPVLNGDPSVLNGTMSNIASVNSGAVAYCKSFLNNQKSAHCTMMDIRHDYGRGFITGTLDNYNLVGDKYIYYSIFSPGYAKGTVTFFCGTKDSVLNVNALNTPGTSTLIFNNTKFYCHEPADIDVNTISPEIDSMCGTGPTDDICANAGTASVSIRAGIGHGQDCNFSASVSVTPGAGWHVTGYTFSGPCIQGISVLSTNNSYIYSFTLINGYSCVITISIDLVDAAGHHCTIKLNKFIGCKNGTGVITDYGCAGLTLTQAGQSYINGNCGYSFTANVTPDPGWTVVKYLWTGPGLLSYTHISAANSDTEPSFILHPGGSATVTVTVLLVDANGNYCTVTETAKVNCPGCGVLVVTPVATINASSCSFTCTANVTPDAGWSVVDYTWDGPGGTYTNPASSAPNTDTYNPFTLMPGTAASVGVSVHLSDGNGNDCYLSQIVPSIGCPSDCGTVQVTPTASANDSGCSVSTVAVVNPEPGWTIVDYQWSGPAGQYTDVTSNTQDTYQSFGLQPGTAANVSVIVDMTDAYGNGDSCKMSQTVQATCSSNKQNNGNSGFNGVQVKKGIIIYPNPTDGIINISSAENNINTVEVYDIAGKKLIYRQFGAINEAHISIEGYAAGTYIVKVNNDVKQIVNKIK